VGTQQIENTIRDQFKEKNIFRFDSDSMKTISAKKQALLDLSEADIIVGTKMLTT